MVTNRFLLLTLLLSLLCCTVRKEEGDPFEEPAPPEEKKEAALYPEQAPESPQTSWEQLFDPAAYASPPKARSPKEATSIPAFPTPSASAGEAPASKEASATTTLPAPGTLYRLIKSPERETR